VVKSDYKASGLLFRSDEFLSLSKWAWYSTVALMRYARTVVLYCTAVSITLYVRGTCMQQSAFRDGV